MTHGSLFSGIGGFDLAAEKAGWTNAFHCENNSFCQKVLKHYWPNATSYGDIKQTDFSPWAGTVDVVSGGFPCQPYSTAGKRQGKNDERHLWPEMLRAIQQINPTWVVGENVRGLISWNGGVVFDEVQADLEAAGYEVLAFLLPASGVGAPHQRYRIWFVAHRADAGAKSVRQNREDAVYEFTDAADANGTRFSQWVCTGKQCDESKNESLQRGKSCGANTTHVAHATAIRLERRTEETPGQNAADGNPWSEFPTQSPVCGGNDGLPTELDGITFSKWREESIRGYGNAVVPHLAYQIFKAINKFNLQA